MKITDYGEYFIGSLEDAERALTDGEKQKLLALGNEETEEEIFDMIAEAETLAAPKALFAVDGVQKTERYVSINGVEVGSDFVAEKLGDRLRCFPYIVTCGAELNAWADGYAGDPLSEYWADEIKQLYLQKLMKQFFPYLKEQYHTGGHLTALNPGSLADWPVAGQRELFAILGGADAVKEKIGVVYTDSFLMIPNKTVSGIAFESEVFFENCQLCPIEGCPNRRAIPMEGLRGRS